ncbi:MAG: type 1 glutamine amidotransferase domain-containing protein [Vicinamibacteraceae bacterium]
MAQLLGGKNIAVLVTDGFEQVELLEPKRALEEAGATVHVLAPKSSTVRGWNHTEWGESVPVDREVGDVSVNDYDALLLPGGVMSPDHLRMDNRAVALVREFFDQAKPIASICHGPWTLVEADVVRGYRVTSYGSLKTDLINAGADWVDEPVVVDRGLVTSRKPDDIPAFNRKMIEEFAEGLHGVAGHREPSGARIHG